MTKRKSNNNNDFVIVIDSREQKPYKFPGIATVIKGLTTGDYSVLGLEESITIERKSKKDAYSTIGNGRDRFTRELERLATYDYAAIVVETTMQNFLVPPAYSSLHPHAAINSLLAWSVKYGIAVFFCDTRNLARGTVYRLLEKFWRYHNGNDKKISSK